LLAHRPGAREVESFTQPQHGLKPPNRSSCRMEGLKAADPRHGPLDPEVVALDPLLQVLADVMERILRQKSLFPGGRDGRRVGAGTICADPVGCEQGLVLQHLAEEALGSVQVARGGEQEIDRGAVLVDGPIQIAPLAADFDVCLVDANRPAVRLAEGSQSTFNQRR
jgi:hypothetical protein